MYGSIEINAMDLCEKREEFLFPKTTLEQNLRQVILLSQVWYNGDVVTRKKNKYLASFYS